MFVLEKIMQEFPKILAFWESETFNVGQCFRTLAQFSFLFCLDVIAWEMAGFNVGAYSLVSFFGGLGKLLSESEEVSDSL